MKKYYIETYGCQMNEHDSEVFAGALFAEGYIAAESIGAADLIIVNTCCVRDSAEQKIYGKMGEYKNYKLQNPQLIIVVAGCLAQKEQKKLLQKFNFVDLVIGNNNIGEFIDIVKKIAIEKNRVLLTNDNQPQEYDIKGRRVSRILAWVAITRGCDNFCSYCIVPYVRGRENSRLIKDVVNEINGLTRDGVKEVTLLGQNVNSFGKGNNETFTQLLEEIEYNTDIKRLRFMTSHPKDFSSDIIKQIAKSKKICQHIHLPLQSGSNKILLAMNRMYTVEQYEKIITEIRWALPCFALTTDIIVGFPGEEDIDFRETLTFMEKIRFDNAFTFMYSQRSNTPAAKQLNQIPATLKKSRLHELMDIQNKISLTKNLQYISKTIEVLAEKPTNKNPNIWQGRSLENKLVFWENKTQIQSGDCLKIKIQRAQTWQLFGEAIINE